MRNVTVCATQTSCGWDEAAVHGESAYLSACATETSATRAMGISHDVAIDARAGSNRTASKYRPAASLCVALRISNCTVPRLGLAMADLTWMAIVLRVTLSSTIRSSP